jgi:predicted porin
MKKTLIALAALAATGAFAQSSVTLGGLVDAGYQSYNAKGNKFQTVGSNGSATTNFTFTGVEDLGSGLKAEFRFEIDPGVSETANRTAGTSAQGTTSNVTSSVGNGASFVGASGAFGAIKFGTPNVATLSINGEGNGGFATAIGSGYRVSSFDAVRFQNSLRYDTPNLAGFSGSLVYSPKNDKQVLPASAGLSGNLNNQTNGRDGAQEIGLAYANGPLSVRYANLVVKQYAGLLGTADPYNGITIRNVATPGAEFKIDSLSAKYSNALPGLSLSYFYQKVSSDVLSAVTSAGALGSQRFDRETNGVAASYAISSAMTAMVNYQEVKNGANASTTTGSKANLKGNVLGLGLDYALSKRTTAYVRYERDTDKNNAGFRNVSSGGYATVGTDYTYTATAVGLRHAF